MRPAKVSKLAKTRKAFRLARQHGALVWRTMEQRQHIYYLVLPANKVWIATDNRDLWLGGPSFGSPSGCPDINDALAKIAKGVKDNE